jgi:hypothetical protein
MGHYYINNDGDGLEVLEQRGKQCLVYFDLTGSTRWANIDNVRVGKVKDLMKPSRYGVGYPGKFDRAVEPTWKAAMQLWSNMLKRCYTDDPRGYRKHGVIVAKEWHCFATFLRDIKKLPGFDGWLGGGYNLDKDFIVEDCKVYSPETCQFLPEAVNKAAGKKGKKLVGGVWVRPDLNT